MPDRGYNGNVDAERPAGPAGALNNAHVQSPAPAGSLPLAVVCIGVKEESLPALETLLRGVPLDTPLAFVLAIGAPVPTENFVHQLLARSTALTVLPAVDGQSISA